MHTAQYLVLYITCNAVLYIILIPVLDIYTLRVALEIYAINYYSIYEI